MLLLRQKQHRTSCRWGRLRKMAMAKEAYSNAVKCAGAAYALFTSKKAFSIILIEDLLSRLLCAAFPHTPSGRPGIKCAFMRLLLASSILD